LQSQAIDVQIDPRLGQNEVFKDPTNFSQLGKRLHATDSESSPSEYSESGDSDRGDGEMGSQSFNQAIDSRPQDDPLQGKSHMLCTTIVLAHITQPQALMFLTMKKKQLHDRIPSHHDMKKLVLPEK
jgi:hypothetical protein